MDNSILLNVVPVVIIVVSAIIEKALNCRVKFTGALLVAFFLLMFFAFKEVNLIPAFVTAFISYAAISIIFSTYRKVRYDAPNVANNITDTVDKIKDEISK